MAKDIRHITLLVILLAALGLSSCENPLLNPVKNKLTKDVLHELMLEWYLWNDSIPSVNPNDYGSLTELLNAMMVNPPDRWSDVLGTEEYQALYQRSEYIGHGFGLTDDAEGNLWVGFVYDQTMAGAQGVERGWQILKINGIPVSPEMEFDTIFGKDEVGVQNSFSFKTREGSTTEMTLSKEIVEINSVLYSDIIQLVDTSIGYLVYQHFLYESTDELDQVFSEFQAANVSEVIVDLRYNPGGQVNVAQHLASLIAGESAIKGTFVKFEYNNNKAGQNVTKPYMDLEYTLAKTPERVFFITTGRSASSSEALINGMYPYADVFLVGDDTYGKPVGSHTFSFIDSTLIPITFNMLNRFNEGGFFDGLPADSYVQEDVKIDFGDPEEKMLKEVLHYMETGNWTGAAAKKSHPYRLTRLSGISSLTAAN